MRSPHRSQSWKAGLVIAVLVAALVLLSGGAAASWFGGNVSIAHALWVVGTLIGLLFAVGSTLVAARQPPTDSGRDRDPRVGGTLWVGVPLAGGVITVMLATGRVLETRADARARRELSMLVARAVIGSAA